MNWNWGEKQKMDDGLLCYGKKKDWCATATLSFLRPRLAGASQAVFIMRQSRIQILGCGCSPHLSDWMRRSATWRQWEAKAPKTHRNVSFWNKVLFLPPSVHRRNSSHICVLGGEWTHGFVWCARCRHEPRVRLQYQQRHDDAAQHQSACIHDTRPGCTFYTACANIDELHPLTSYQRAQDCVFYARVSDTFNAMLRSGLSSSNTTLSSWDPRSPWPRALILSDFWHRLFVVTSLMNMSSRGCFALMYGIPSCVSAQKAQ